MCIDLLIYFKLEISNIIRDHFFSKILSVIIIIHIIMWKPKFKW